jgi:short-subunit dehydrogenase
MGAARRALVTGASSGIGEATAKLLASRGYRVALLARRGVELERVRASLPNGEAHFALECDLRDDAALERAVAQVRSRFGGLDLLVQNAGHGYLANVEETEPHKVRELLELNVASVIALSRLALPLLRAGDAPVMVLVSSIVGRRGIPGQAVYAASKAALNSLGEALRIEWAADAIAVCTLDVGLTRTPFFANQPNPRALPGPNLAGAADPASVAAAILGLDRAPRPELYLSLKWRLLAMANVLAPRLADRLLVRRMGGGWRAPTR